MITREHKTLIGSTGAVFSDCERYRYRLWRTWSDGPIINWLMLNPSTADELHNDPTIEGCQRRSTKWGYGGLIVTNLFAYRATQPKDMKAQKDPIGPYNDYAIMAAAVEARTVVCAWGNDGGYLDRSRSVLTMLRPWHRDKLHVLKMTGKDQPYHPLYVAHSIEPTLYA